MIIYRCQQNDLSKMVEVCGLTGYKNSKKVLNVQGKSVKIFTSKCKNRPIYHFLNRLVGFVIRRKRV